MIRISRNHHFAWIPAWELHQIDEDNAEKAGVSAVIQWTLSYLSSEAELMYKRMMNNLWHHLSLTSRKSEVLLTVTEEYFNMPSTTIAKHHFRVGKS